MNIYLQETCSLPDERIKEDPPSGVPVHLFPLAPTEVMKIRIHIELFETTNEFAILLYIHH